MSPETLMDRINAAARTSSALERKQKAGRLLVGVAALSFAVNAGVSARMTVALARKADAAR
jgi:hypothetical protein